MIRKTRRTLRNARREAAHWKRWCQAAEAERDRLLDGMEIAWGVIANANGGNWDGETPEWQAAAERWRDEQWHPALDRLVPLSAEATDDPCPTCKGRGCEYGCGHCHESPSVAGPDAHRQCVTCHGSGLSAEAGDTDG